MGNRKKMIETFEKFTEIASYMEAIQKDFPEDIYYLGILEDKFLTFQKPELSIEENLQLLIDVVCIFVIPERLHRKLRCNTRHQSIFLFFEEIPIHDRVKSCTRSGDNACTARRRYR